MISHSLWYLCKVILWFLLLPILWHINTWSRYHKLFMHLSFSWILSSFQSVFSVGPFKYSQILAGRSGPYGVYSAQINYTGILKCLAGACGFSQPASPLRVSPFPFKKYLQPRLFGACAWNVALQAGALARTLHLMDMRDYPSSFPRTPLLCEFFWMGEIVSLSHSTLMNAPWLGDNKKKKIMRARSYRMLWRESISEAGNSDGGKRQGSGLGSG